MSLDRPRFRRDLLAEAVEVDGQRYVDVHDPGTGSSFRLYDFEYHVALAFDGLAYETIIPWLKLACGIDITPEQLREFAVKLHELGFLEGDWPRAGRSTQAPDAATDESADRAADESGAESTVESTDAAGGEGTAESADEDAPPEPNAVSVTPAVVTLDESGEAPPQPAAAAAWEPAPAAPAPEPVVETAPETASAPAEPAVATKPEDGTVEAAEATAEETATSIAEASPEPVPEPTAEPAAPPEASPAPLAAVPLQPTISDSITVPYTHPDVPALFAAHDTSSDQRPAVSDATDVVAPASDAADEGPEALPATDLANVVVVPKGPVGPMRTWPAPYFPATDVVVSPAHTVADIVRASLVSPAPDPGTLGPVPVPKLVEPAPVASDAAREEPAASTSDAAEVERAVAADAQPSAPVEHAVATEPPAASEAEPVASVTQEQHPAPVEAPAASETADAIADDSATSPQPADEPASPAAATYPVDSTAFPVLPTPPPQTMEPPRAVTPVVVMPLVVTPPSRQSSGRFPTPPPYVTPAPTTLGPLPVAVRRRQRRSLVLFGSLGVLAAAAVLAIALPFFFPPQGPPRANVRSVAATPGTVFRYFASVGTVAPLPGPVMKFPAAGKVIRIAKPGTAVAVGDVLAAVESARPLLTQLTQQRERLAFYQQMADGMHQAGNSAEAERQDAKVEERRAKVGKTLAALGQVAVVARTAGEVDEAFAQEGDTVEAGSLALRMGSSGHRAIFDLSRAQAAEARRLGFCQVGVDGYVFDCQLAEDRPDDARVSVELMVPSTLVGRPARLARARYETAVVLPASAVLPAGKHHQVYVISPAARIEARTVTVAENTASEAIVLQGLDAGDRVVVDPPSDLRPGATVASPR